MKAEYLVTGGAGFIGSNTVEFLVARGAAVRALDDFSTGRRENLAGIGKKIEVIEGDIRDPEIARAAVKGVRFVLHMAAVASVSRSIADPLGTSGVNIMGTLALLMAARDAGVERVVLSSSASVYGNAFVQPKHEKMAPSPMSPYALTKLVNEHQGRLFYELYGLKTCALRYFNVYGPRQDPKSPYAAVIPLFIEAWRNGKAPVVYGDGGQTRDFVYVEDVCEAQMACCSAPDAANGCAINIGCGERMTINELAAAIARVMGRDGAPRYEAPRQGDVRDSLADISLAAETLGWRPRVAADEGLRKTVEWFLSN